MKDLDRWIYFDGPEPDAVRVFLDALRYVPPPTAEEKKREAERLFARIDAFLAERGIAVRAAGVERATSGEGETGGERDALAGGLRAGERASEPHVEEARPEEARAGGAFGAVVPRMREPQLPEPGERWAGEPSSARAPSGDPAIAPEPAAELHEPEGGDRATVELSMSGVFQDPAGALPFRPPVPGRPRAPRTLQAAVMPRKGLGETAPVDDDRIAKAVRSLPPFLGNTVGSGAVPFPRLTLERYASLRVELSLGWQPVGEILAKYHVLHEAARVALDAHWEKVLTERPEMRGELERAMETWARWLRGGGR